ncbi:conserved hypothetical protein [Chloroherpeton thalassium ATCC 35110]|uniref:DUF4412 domain-containing protein n=1 Tax=Chloroherpeton thalassium (strain ATCC 35110 / GB-78) TaxID=517418 RepID=B3QTN1_CHLT3|nr:DUF4412 domain-containing protein [Chloroherpeton thalassium]ACF12777.1 conserved hypothetical protein [Chloroherpeton thalassium ATCC 35110]
MKKRTTPVIFLFLLFFCAQSLAYAKKSFEGRLELQISAPKFSGSAEFFLSKQGIRIEAKGEKMQQIMLIRQKSNALYQLNLSEKTYSEIDLEETRRRSAALSHLKNYTIEKLGEEKVLGYSCSHFTISDGRLTLELWTSKDILDGESLKRLSSASQFLGVNEKMLDAMDAQGVGGFPVKMRADMQGREVVTELKSIQAKNLPQSLFDLPADYVLQEAASSEDAQP